MTRVANNSPTRNTEESMHTAYWDFTSEEPEWMDGHGKRFRLENGQFFMEMFDYRPNYRDYENQWNDCTEYFDEADFDELLGCNAPREVIIAAEQLLQQNQEDTADFNRQSDVEDRNWKTHTIQFHPEFVKMATEYFEERGEDITQYFIPMTTNAEVGQ